MTHAAATIRSVPLAGLIALATLTSCAGAAGEPGGATAPSTVNLGDPGTPAINEPAARPSEYRLVWSDEFDRPGLPDPAKWAYDTARNREGWHNAERQYYSASRPENARVEDGRLVIEARRENFGNRAPADYGGQQYTSARLLTRGIADWTYGFIEVRAQLACGRGLWPAIWMLGSADQPWPAVGEIDIMEHVGHEQGTVYGTVHTGRYNHVAGTHKGSKVTLPDACTAFHRYQLHWTRDRITIGVDDRAYFSFRNDGTGEASWPFFRPEYLILNVAVGGNWGGAKGIDDAAFPSRMLVDYVRVWQPAQ